MATVVEEFVALLGWEVDDKELKSFQQSIKDVTETVATIAKVAAASAVAVIGATSAMNVHTARVTRTAEALGVQAETLEALGSVAREIGFDFENVADLVEEMNNKIGESAGIEQMSSVKDSVKLLGLEFEEIRKMAPEEQFLTILDAAKELEDQQQAVSAVDMLFGGEANKFLGLLRTYDMSLTDIIDRQKELNVLSDEGRQGALAFGFAFNELRTVGASLFAEFSGLLGEALVPIVKSTTDWVLANKDLIKTKVIGFVKGFAKAIQIAFDVFKWFFDKVVAFIDAFGGLGNLLKTSTVLVGAFVAAMAVQKILAFATAVKVAGGAMAFFGNVMATAQAKAVGIALFAAAIFLLVEDIKTFLEGGDSLVGQLNDKIQPAIEGAVDSVFNFISAITGIPFDEIMNGLVMMFEEPFKTLEQFVEALGILWVNIKRGVKNSFSSTINSIATVFKSVFNRVYVFIMQIIRKIKGFYNGIIDSIVSRFRWLVGKIQSFIGKVKGFLPDSLVNFIEPNAAGAQAGSTSNSRISNVVINNNNTVNASGNAIEGASVAAGTLASAAAQTSRNLRTQVQY